VKKVIIFLTVLETPHVLVGAAIATKVGSPWLSLPLSFASHFILEKVPHWNPHLNTEKKKFGKVTPESFKVVLADSTLALVSGSYIAFQQLPDTTSVVIVLAACFLSVLPDLIEAPYFFLNINHNKYIHAWIKFQKSLQVDTGIFWGLATQLVVSIAALYWILG